MGIRYSVYNSPLGIPVQCCLELPKSITLRPFISKFDRPACGDQTQFLVELRAPEDAPVPRWFTGLCKDHTIDLLLDIPVEDLISVTPYKGN